MEHESRLERHFIHVALACPAVVEVEHQPPSIELTLEDGTLRKYTADFRIVLGDGTVVTCETKPEKFEEEFRPISSAAAAHFQMKGEHYMLVTSRQIYDNSRSARAILLMRYGRLQFTPEQAAECKKLLEEEMRGSAHVQHLVERGISESLVWHLVATHALRTTTPLNISPLETVEINQPLENCLDHFQRWLGHTQR